MKLEDQEKINLIGLWSLRAILAIGAIVLGVMGKGDSAAVCGILCVWSFILL